MGWYRRYLFPRLMDLAMRGPEARALREELVGQARGQVLEVGFGTGLNARYYPREVERVVGLEPNRGMWSLAAERARKSAVPIELLEGSAEALPFPAHSFDTVVATATLCSIQEVERALQEMHRVLRPGGQYLFFEHGLSPDPGVGRWQRRLNGLWMRLGDGCRLDRDVAALIQGTGFRLHAVRRLELASAPRVLAHFTAGSARPGGEVPA